MNWLRYPPWFFSLDIRMAEYPRRVVSLVARNRLSGRRIAVTDNLNEVKNYHRWKNNLVFMKKIQNSFTQINNNTKSMNEKKGGSWSFLPGYCCPSWMGPWRWLEDLAEAKHEIQISSAWRHASQGRVNWRVQSIKGISTAYQRMTSLSSPVAWPVLEPSKFHFGSLLGSSTGPGSVWLWIP